MVKNPPANAGDISLLLMREDPTGAEQLSLCASAIEPALQSREPQLLKPERPRAARETTAMRSLRAATREQSVLSASQEKPSQQRRPSTTIKIND